MTSEQAPEKKSARGKTSECAAQYCDRLAGVLHSSETMKCTFRAALTKTEINLEHKELGLEGPPGENLAPSVSALTKILQGSPRLQSIASSCTNYTPSVWLLEQELRARGKGNDICARAKLEQLKDTTRAICNHAPLPGPCVADAYDVYAVAREVNASGLCFSGGGIRSATFNLGVLQGLASLGLLGKFDYLSSVSGGGYIHQFVAAWLQNYSPANDPQLPCEPPREPLAYVVDRLTPLPQERTPSTRNLTEQPEPIRWLRRYSNYLTPRTGMFSTDTWVMAAVWMRNTMLNQIVLISTLATFLCIPHLIARTDWSWGVFRHAYISDFLWGLHIPYFARTNVPYIVPTILVFVLGCAATWRVVALLRQSMKGPEALSDVSEKKVASKSKANGVRRFADSIAEFVGRRYNSLLSWESASYLLLAISLVMAPALFRSVFTNQSMLWVDLAPKSSSPGMAPGCLSKACDAKDVAISEGLPLASAKCPYCENAKHRMDALSAWFAKYNYPIWSGLELHPIRPGFPVAASFLVFLAMFCFSTGIASSDINTRSTRSSRFWVYLCAVVSALLSVGLGYVVLHGIRVGMFALYFFVPAGLYGAIALVLLPCLLMAAIFLAMMINAGIMGNLTDDALREDMARLRALAMFVAMLWVGITGFSLLGPAIVHSLSDIAYLRHGALISWLGTTIASVLAGKSTKTSSTMTDSTSKLSTLIVAGPPIFVIGLLLAISTGVQWIITNFCKGHDFQFALLMTLGFAAVALLFGYRLDINDFSMHAFYRDRIARCYSGASYPNRRPDRFTGFARSDSQSKVAELLPAKFKMGIAEGIGSNEHPDYAGPLPIFCTTVNLTFGQDLAWQERKGASFCFTPLYSGYSVGWTSEHLLRGMPRYTYNGFAKTQNYAYKHGGIQVHSAVAISGAAVSPNSGYHTNPAMAFLLTMFNVRLGWWIKNPRLARETFMTRPASPPFPLRNLLSELMGRATDTEPYVYLTDGGHFDNMGLYELVRRRCRRLLVCDAEQDGKNTFEGIGMSIRKARVDFGVEIDLDLRRLDPRIVDPSTVPPASTAAYHFVKGTIRYPEDMPDEYGVVIYIKASITGNEPGDVLNYKRENSEFPHESTGDQWFSESQFESYRRLGYHIVLGDEAKMRPLREELSDLFEI